MNVITVHIKQSVQFVIVITERGYDCSMHVSQMDRQKLSEE
jgi:hypothetical protein